LNLGKLTLNASNDIARRSAILNALSSIDKDSRFSEKVLLGHWEDYLFFEPTLMFDPPFIDVTSLLLSEEKARVIALINLGNVTPIDYSDPPVMLIEHDTTAKQYIAELETKEDGWRFWMDRYVCASDTGSWSIYCEKENDVGVFAFGHTFPKSLCSQIQNLLRGMSIRLSSNVGDPDRFDFGKLLPDWKAKFIAEHFDGGA
jgi:hypothetical protein